MLQLIAMDLDGTLADYNASILPETVQLLQQLQGEGIKLVFATGKAICHLAGLVRQSGLENVILVGDNGGVIHFNHHYPPKNPRVLEMTNAAAAEMETIRKALLAEFGEKIWIQPNQVTLSLFGRSIDIAKAYEFCDRIFEREKIKHLKSFKTAGALDIIPRNIDKGVALKLIQQELQIPMEHTAVIGDGSNDVPMFLQGKLRQTFPKSAEIFMQFVPKIVKDINTALKFLLELSQFEKNMNFSDLV
ncbi:MAG TPA: HAD-IIB family hydrolase [Candidatus Deferrimicrobium sp.]|nr:HAD-IIB family hydrolase [Candidatus Deferrimicrobium sp.]